MNRLVKAALIAAFAAGIAAAGPALADENPLSSNPAGAAATGNNGAATSAPAPGATDTTMPPAVLPTYPVAEVDRPLQLPKGLIEAGATIAVNDGVGCCGGYSFGNWVGFNLRADYGVTDKIQAGVRIPLLLVKPDLSQTPSGASAAVFGGFLVDGMYRINDMVSAHAVLGVARPEGIPFNEAVYPIYNVDGLRAGIRAGVAVKKRFMADKLAIAGDPSLAIQLDSAPNGSGGSKTFVGLRIPVAALYQVKPNLAAGVRTGIYTGGGFSFSGNDGASIPFLLEGQYTMMKGNLDVGADLGFASLLTRSDKGLSQVVAPYDSVGDSLYFGLSAAWRHFGLQ